MGFVRDISRGIRAYGKAISLLFSSKLWYFMLFPVVIVIVLFVAGNYAVGYLGDGLSGVIEAKMTVAKQMLNDTRMRVEDVAYAVGYENYISFYNVFKRIEHMSPSEYRFQKWNGEQL